jgi:hypothetical protein
MSFTPGWSHTQTAQDATNNYIALNTPCSNGETGLINWGDGYGYNPTTSFPPRPLGCPVAWGGAGTDYADRTPLMFGPDGGPDGFQFLLHGSPVSSFGIVKVKAGPVGTQFRLIFLITSGAYAPPAGKKTKVKLTVSIAPWPGHSYSCADDTDPLELVELTSVGPVLVIQK